MRDDRVFPAQAGVILSRTLTPNGICGFPRASGGILGRGLEFAF